MMMQRFFVLNETIFCATDSKPEFLFSSQSALVPCAMTILAVRGDKEHRAGDVITPRTTDLIRLATMQDVPRFNAPKICIPAIAKQEAETAMTAQEMASLLEQLNERYVVACKTYENFRVELAILICRGDKESTAFNELYDRLKGLIGIALSSPLNHTGVFAVIREAIKDFRATPMADGMPEPISAIEELRRGHSNDIESDGTRSLIIDMLSAYDAARELHQVVLNIHNTHIEAIQKRERMSEIVRDMQFLHYDISLVSQQLADVDKNFKPSLSPFNGRPIVAAMELLNMLIWLMEGAVDAYSVRSEITQPRQSYAASLTVH